MKGVSVTVSIAVMLGSWMGAVLVASLDRTTIALAAANAIIVVLAWIYARRRNTLLAMLPIGALVVFSATFANGANFRWFGAFAILSLLASVAAGTVIGRQRERANDNVPRSDP